MRLLLPLLATCALAVSACGSGGGGGGDGDGATAPPAGASRTSGDERVIEAWSRDLARGDVTAAAARFAVPAVVANGTPPVKLTSRESIRAFHDTLPCGGVLVATEPHHGLTIARFRLTDRPGGDCGDGAGGYAAAAFEIDRGRIVRWLRVEDRGTAPPAGPLV